MAVDDYLLDGVISSIISDLDKVLWDSDAEDEPCEGHMMDPHLPSVGSAGHKEGMCRPCAHNWKPAGCSKGRACTFCHICGEKDFQRKRKDNIAKRRAKRSLIRQLAPGIHGDDRGTARERSASKGDASEDSEPLLTSSCQQFREEYRDLFDRRATDELVQHVPQVPASKDRQTASMHGGSLGDQLVESLLKAAEEKVPRQCAFEEQETATPSSEECQELRTPPCGPTAPGAAARFHPLRTNADGLSEYGASIFDAARTIAPLGEPARVEIPKATDPDQVVAAVGQPPCLRHASVPIHRVDPKLEPAWVPLPFLDAWQDAVQPALTRDYVCPLTGGTPLPCSLMEVPEADRPNAGVPCRPPPGLDPPQGITNPIRPPTPERFTPSRRATDIVSIMKDERDFSMGSVGHAKGTCRPCAHIWKPAGCSKGKDCEFCHVCGEEDFQRQRKRNANRRKAKRVSLQHVESERRVGQA